MEKTQTAEKVTTAKTVEKGLGVAELYAISIGTVIGAGVFTVLGSAIAVTGKSVWIAYVVAVILGFLLNFPSYIVSHMAVLQGGSYSMVSGLLGQKWAGMFLLMYVPVSFSYALFGLGLGQYVQALFPMVSAKLVGVLVITFFFVLNLFSMKNMAALQKLMTWLLIASLLIFIVFGLPKINSVPFEFASEDYFLNGGSGFVTALILLIYSTTSYIQVTNYGGVARNPKKDTPKVIVMSAVTILIIYACAAIVSTGILPIDQVAGQPLTYVAAVILPKPLFVVLILGGVVMALATTLNSMFGSFGRIFAQGCADGWFPDWLAKRNRYDQPYILFTITWLIGILPIILDFDINTITNNIVLVSYAMALLPRAAMFMMPTKYPEVCKKSKAFGSKGVFYFINAFSLVLHIVVTYLAASALTPTIVIVSLSALALCVVFALMRSKSGRVVIHSSFKVD